MWWSFVAYISSWKGEKRRQRRKILGKHRYDSYCYREEFWLNEKFNTRTTVFWGFFKIYKLLVLWLCLRSRLWMWSKLRQMLNVSWINICHKLELLTLHMLYTHGEPGSQHAINIKIKVTHLIFMKEFELFLSALCLSPVSAKL